MTAKTTKSGTTSTSKKTKFYGDPELRNFLYYDWLLMTNYFEGMINLPRVLESFGMSGYVTGFFQTDTDVCFVYNKKVKTIRFFDVSKKTEENECLIDGISYNSSFALINKSENSWTFYYTDDDFSTVFPVFRNYRFTNGGCCTREISSNASTLDNTFKVNGLKDSAVFLHISIPNQSSSVKQLDSLMPEIINVLDKTNKRDICHMYDLLKNQLKKVSGSYDIIYQSGSSNEITDAIYIENGRVQKYILSYENSKRISLERNHNWVYTEPNLKILREGKDIYFAGSTNEYELDKVELLKDTVRDITVFIETNMASVF